MEGFEELKSKVLDRGLCTGCGTCIGICPVNTLAYMDGRIMDAKRRCIKCGMCNSVCPGREFSMDEWSSKLFQKRYDTGSLFGSYRAIYNISPKDNEIRISGASGGVVTQILIDLLESHKIKGAVAVRAKQDEPYKFEPFIAVNKEQIMAAAQSKYVILPVNQVIQEIKKSGKKVAYVGLPCQIQGMRKAMKNNAWLAGQIVVLISLFCGFNLEMEATEYLIAKSGIKKPEIEKLSYRHKKDGRTGFYIRGKNGKEFFVSKHGYTFMNLIFSPVRCWKCYDYSGEFADISVGDSWEKGQGFSRVIVRTQVGSEIIENLRNQNLADMEPCDESVIARTQKKVVTYKKRQIAVRKRRMKSFPDYGVEFNRCRGKVWVKGIVLYRVLAFFKSPLGKAVIRFLPFRLMVKMSERLKGREVIQGEDQ